MQQNNEINRTCVCLSKQFMKHDKIGFTRKFSRSSNGSEINDENTEIR